MEWAADGDVGEQAWYCKLAGSTYRDIIQSNHAAEKTTAEAGVAYGQITLARRKLQELAREGGNTLDAFVRHPEDTDRLATWFSANFGGVGKDIDILESAGEKLLDLWRETNPHTARSMRFPWNVEIPRQFNDVWGAYVALAVEAEALQRSYPVTAQVEREVIRRAEERFSFGEVFANSVHAFILGITDEKSHEHFPCPPEMGRLLEGMRYYKKPLFVRYQPDSKPLNNITLHGDIPHTN